MWRQRWKSQRRPLAAIAGLAGVISAVLLVAYNPEQDNVSSRPVPARWDNATTAWTLFPAIGSNVDNATAAASAVAASTNTWTSTTLNGQRLNNLTMTQVAGSSSTPSDPDLNVIDCLNVISFSPSSAISFPTGAIAFTEVSTQTGTPPFSYSCTSAGTTTTKTCHLFSCIIDADMAFNPKENFSTTTPPPAKSFDVQSVATHEFGHFIGLDHNGIAHTIMYPFGDTGSNGVQQNLAVDDAVGVAFLYPAPGFANATGSISGRITQGGSGIFAAHVVFTDANSGAAMVDGLSNPDGTYSRFVPPGTYTVVVIPLAASANSGVYTLSDFGGWYCGYSENSPPCCDPKSDPTCTGASLTNPTNYTAKFF